MLRVALLLSLAAIGAYVAFPTTRALIVANAPLLLALVCPVSMIVMMGAMRGGGSNSQSCHGTAHGSQAPTSNPAPEKA